MFYPICDSFCRSFTRNLSLFTIVASGLIATFGIRMVEQDTVWDILACDCFIASLNG